MENNSIDPITGLPPHKSPRYSPDPNFTPDLETRNFGMPMAPTYEQPMTPDDYDPTGRDRLYHPEKNINDARAATQSGWTRAGNAVAQIAAEVTLGALENIGYMFDHNTFDNVIGAEKDFENWWSTAWRSAKEHVQDEWFPIYQTQRALDEFAPGDPTWWAGNAKTLGSTLALLLPVYGEFALASKLGKTLRIMAKEGSLVKYPRLAKIAETLAGVEAAGEAPNSLSRALLQAGFASTQSRIIENNLEAFGAFEEYRDLLKSKHPYLSQDSIDKRAGELAAGVWRGNSAMLAVDFFQHLGFVKGLGRLFGNRKVGALATGTSERFKLPLGLELAGQMAGEAAEETYQSILQLEGRYAAEENADFFGSGFGDRVNDYLRSPETQTSAFWGAAGGGVFFAASNLKKLYKDSTERRDAMSLGNIINKAELLNLNGTIANLLSNFNPLENDWSVLGQEYLNKAQTEMGEEIKKMHKEGVSESEIAEYTEAAKERYDRVSKAVELARIYGMENFSPESLDKNDPNYQENLKKEATRATLLAAKRMTTLFAESSAANGMRFTDAFIDRSVEKKEDAAASKIAWREAAIEALNKRLEKFAKREKNEERYNSVKKGIESTIKNLEKHIEDIKSEGEVGTNTLKKSIKRSVGDLADTLFHSVLSSTESDSVIEEVLEKITEERKNAGVFTPPVENLNPEGPIVPEGDKPGGTPVTSENEKPVDTTTKDAEDILDRKIKEDLDSKGADVANANIASLLQGLENLYANQNANIDTISNVLAPLGLSSEEVSVVAKALIPLKNDSTQDISGFISRVLNRHLAGLGANLNTEIQKSLTSFENIAIAPPTLTGTPSIVPGDSEFSSVFPDLKLVTNTEERFGLVKVGDELDVFYIEHPVDTEKFPFLEKLYETFKDSIPGLTLEIVFSGVELHKDGLLIANTRGLKEGLPEGTIIRTLMFKVAAANKSINTVTISDKYSVYTQNSKGSEIATLVEGTPEIKPSLTQGGTAVLVLPDAGVDVESRTGEKHIDLLRKNMKSLSEAGYSEFLGDLIELHILQKLGSNSPRLIELQERLKNVPISAFKTIVNQYVQIVRGNTKGDTSKNAKSENALRYVAGQKGKNNFFLGITDTFNKIDAYISEASLSNLSPEAREAQIAKAIDSIRQGLGKLKVNVSNESLGSDLLRYTLQDGLYVEDSIEYNRHILESVSTKLLKNRRISINAGNTITKESYEKAFRDYKNSFRQKPKSGKKIDETKLTSLRYRLNKDTEEYEDTEGKNNNLKRITSVISDGGFNEEGNEGSLLFGGVIDKIAREFFQLSGSISEKKAKLYGHLYHIDNKKTKSKYIGISQNNMAALLQGLQEIKEYADKRGLDVRTDDLRILNLEYGVIGTTDIELVSRQTGKTVAIFDVKTVKTPQSYHKKFDSTKNGLSKADSHILQVLIYSALRSIEHYGNSDSINEMGVYRVTSSYNEATGVQDSAASDMQAAFENIHNFDAADALDALNLRYAPGTRVRTMTFSEAYGRMKYLMDQMKQNGETHEWFMLLDIIENNLSTKKVNVEEGTFIGETPGPSQTEVRFKREDFPDSQGNTRTPVTQQKKGWTSVDKAKSKPLAALYATGIYTTAEREGVEVNLNPNIDPRAALIHPTSTTTSGKRENVKGATGVVTMDFEAEGPLLILGVGAIQALGDSNDRLGGAGIAVPVETIGQGRALEKRALYAFNQAIDKHVKKNKNGDITEDAFLDAYSDIANDVYKSLNEGIEEANRRASQESAKASNQQATTTAQSATKTEDTEGTAEGATGQATATEEATPTNVMAVQGTTRGFKKLSGNQEIDIKDKSTLRDGEIVSEEVDGNTVVSVGMPDAMGRPGGNMNIMIEGQLTPEEVEVVGKVLNNNKVDENTQDQAYGEKVSQEVKQALDNYRSNQQGVTEVSNNKLVGELNDQADKYFDEYSNEEENCFD